MRVSRSIYLIALLATTAVQAFPGGSRPPSPDREGSYIAYYNEYLSQGPNDRGHCGVFVETQSHGAGTGVLFHVVGSVGPGTGMQYARDEKTRDVRESPEFKQRHPIGRISSSKLGEVDSIARSIPPPQSIFEAGTMKKKQPPPPHYRCREWAQDLARQLEEKGLVQPGDSRSPSPQPATGKGGSTHAGASSPPGSSVSKSPRSPQKPFGTDLLSRRENYEALILHHPFRREALISGLIELYERSLTQGGVTHSEFQARDADSYDW